MSLATPGFSLAVLAQDGQARCTRLQTPRATVETPAFMPVGTQAAVKGLTADEVAATGARVVLANTYHLWLRPGAERVAQLGGVVGMMRWPHALLTDSGGYQVFSLAKLRRIDEDGITFRSHLDGAARRLTPAECMRVQGLLGADIAMALDVCPPAACDEAEMLAAMRLTRRWAGHCLEQPRSPGQACFGIVQGGTSVPLRLAHLQEIAAMPFDGIALGGFSVGEPPPIMWEALSAVAPHMPAERPRYLMGVGTPQDLLAAVGAGIDLFDCVLPTRNARNGQAFTWQGRLNLRNAFHQSADVPVQEGCACAACRTASRAYLHHLFRAREMLGPRLLTQHNLHFYADLMQRARQAIAAGSYAAWARQTLASLADPLPPSGVC